MTHAVGHTKDVVELSACSGRPGLLVSLSKDGTAKVWDVFQELCTTSYSTDAASLVSPHCSLIHACCIAFMTTLQKLQTRSCSAGASSLQSTTDRLLQRLSQCSYRDLSEAAHIILR